MALLRLTGLLALLVACSDIEPGPGLFGDRDAATLSNRDGQAPDDDGGGGIPLRLDAPAGTWGLFVEDRKCMAALGTSVENIIWSWYRVEITEEAGGDDARRFLRQRVELCNQELSPFVGGLLTLVPDAIPAGLPARAITAFLIGAEPGSTYVSDELVDLWGAEGVGPDEALPESVDDPRLVDHDDDGAPGVSFVLANSRGDPLCEVRVVQRTRLRISGQVVDATRVEGTLWSKLDKVVLDQTSPLCGTEAQLVPSPTPSRFVLVRLDGGSNGLTMDLDGDGTVTCSEITGAKDVLHEQPALKRIEPDDAVCK